MLKMLWMTLCLPKMRVLSAAAEHTPLPKRVAKGFPNPSTTPEPSSAMQLSFLKQKERKKSVGWGPFKSKKPKTGFRQFSQKNVWPPSSPIWATPAWGHLPNRLNEFWKIQTPRKSTGAPWRSQKTAFLAADGGLFRNLLFLETPEGDG